MMYNKGRYKAAEDGIKALHIVLNKFPRLKIILFGKDNAPSNLPKNFEYRRNINETQLVELYNSSYIFVSSSISEGFGLPSAEAMSCECAVASTDCGGNRDFAIHNETALISKPGDYKSLAKNILILLNNDVLRDDLSKKSQAHIQNFNWDRAGNQLENFIINKVG